MRVELFLAFRYLKPQRNAVSLITLSSILGVTLGVAVLMIVQAVMTGFIDLMKEKLIETQAHYQVVSSYGGAISRPGIAVRAIEAAGGSAAPVIQAPVMVQYGRRLDPSVMVLGADVEELRKHLDLEKFLQAGKLSLEKGEVVISNWMAQRWGVRVGDRILLHSPERLTKLVDFKPDGGIGINEGASPYLPAEFRVTGMYSLGHYPFDNTVLFLGADDAAELLGLPFGAATSVFGWGPDPFDQKELVGKISNALPAASRLITWEEHNRQMLDVLATEKTVMFFLLIFIVLVAAFSITNTLITSVYQKTREIGILKALGAGDGCVTLVFVFQGLLAGVIGSVCGTSLGFLVLHYRNQILTFSSQVLGVELFPPQFYYFNGLPCHIVPGDVLLVVAASVLLCTAGALLPALRAARLDPAKALRYE